MKFDEVLDTKLLEALPQQPKVDGSTELQLHALRALALKFGLNDAADVLDGIFATSVATTLTRDHLVALRRLRDHGTVSPTASMRSVAGAATARMFDRLQAAGLVTPGPHRRITEKGRKLIAGRERK